MPYQLGKVCEKCGIAMCYDGCACEWSVECCFDNRHYPALCTSHLERTGKDHSAALCDEGVKEKDREIAALKADLRAVVEAAQAVHRACRAEDSEGDLRVPYVLNVRLGIVLVRPGVRKVMEEKSPACPHDPKFQSKYI